MSRSCKCGFSKESETDHSFAYGCRRGSFAELRRGIAPLGAFRTVKDASGLQAVEIAKRTGAEHLLTLLTPETNRNLEPDRLSFIQEMFHGFLRTFMLAYKTPVPLRLPQLSIFTEVDHLRVWFPIPMMAGGCNFWIEEEECQSVLHAETWCRISGGSDMHHRITPFKTTLIEEASV